jgi:TonB family protein
MPDPSGSYRIGCGVTSPKIIHSAEPELSELARRQKVGGQVTVSFTVATNGNPTNIKVIRSLATKVDPKFRKAALSLDDKAIEVVGKYRFAPATYQGSPVAVQMNVNINFQIF